MLFVNIMKTERLHLYKLTKKKIQMDTFCLFCLQFVQKIKNTFDVKITQRSEKKNIILNVILRQQEFLMKAMNTF